MTDIIISGDLSLRSSGITAIDTQGNLVDFTLINNKELDNEDLILYNTETFLEFVDRLNNWPRQYPNYGTYKIAAFVFEGLSFNSFSADKDKIAGNFWSVITQTRKYYPEVPIGIVPVLSWRAPVLSASEQKELKKQHGKLGVKIGVVDKLSDEVRTAFQNYIITKGITWDKKEKNPIYDLADAYFLSKYRLSLE